jgi:hypothetical protein
MAPSSAASTCTEVSESPSRKSETPSNVSDVEAIFMPKIALAGSGKAGASPASSVHELLECPVCTNSMYPPIHQVSIGRLWSFPFARPEFKLFIFWNGEGSSYNCSTRMSPFTLLVSASGDLIRLGAFY